MLSLMFRFKGKLFCFVVYKRHVSDNAAILGGSDSMEHNVISNKNNIDNRSNVKFKFLANFFTNLSLKLMTRSVR